MIGAALRAEVLLGHHIQDPAGLGHDVTPVQLQALVAAELVPRFLDILPAGLRRHGADGKLRRVLATGE